MKFPNEQLKCERGQEHIHFNADSSTPNLTDQYDSGSESG